MATPSPSLTFNGNAEEAFNFYKSVFGGEFSSLMRWKDMPGSKIPPEDSNKIMHVALPVGKSGVVIMGADMPGGTRAPQITTGNNFTISLECESKEEATKLYRGLVAGGKEDPQMPLGDSFWGSYFGMLTDKFSIRWMVNYQYPKK
ncbi:MAG TPA: VOC family protein [Candidatus Kapabacteria bacterium]|jgi:PhnB protein|nr:VOC family protein [Candidatus Kapabacteria bacterium]